MRVDVGELGSALSLFAPSLSRSPSHATMLRGARVQTLNRAALRAARKNQAVFAAARNLATKASPAQVASAALPRPAQLKAAARECPSPPCCSTEPDSPT